MKDPIHTATPTFVSHPARLRNALHVPVAIGLLAESLTRYGWLEYTPSPLVVQPDEGPLQVFDGGLRLLACAKIDRLDLFEYTVIDPAIATDENWLTLNMRRSHLAKGQLAAAVRLIDSAEGRTQSQRAVARLCGVSPHLVRTVDTAIEQVGS